jgi:hypothetical protein
MLKNSVSTTPTIGQINQYRLAKVLNQFDNVRVVVGSEESIFNEDYMTGLVGQNRVVKFKKSALVFAE